MAKRGVAYSFSRGLYDATQPGRFRVNPTIAAGDFKISKDNGAFVDLTNMPVVNPGGSALVLFQLTASEMTATHLTVLGVDQAGGEWTQFMEHLEPDTVTVADLGNQMTALASQVAGVASQVTGLTSQVGALPTAVQVADAVLTRDWTAITTPPAAFSLWNALRFLRNAWNVVPGLPPVLHVKTESGADAWTRTVTTDATALPVTGTQ